MANNFPISIHTASKLKSRSSEDTHSSELLDNGYTYAGVYDGHNGITAAELCANRIPELLSHYMSTRSTYSSLYESFKDVHNEIPNASGTTATVLVTCGAFVIVAHVGDSRAVMCRAGRAVELTEDHKLSFEPERERIQKLEAETKKRVIFGNRVQGLMLTRSIGDKVLTSAISWSPVMHEFLRSPDDHYIIIASDGLWDVCSSERAIEFVRESKLNSAQDIAEGLVDYAVRMYQQKPSHMDDITVTVIFLLDDPHAGQRRRLSWKYYG